MTEQYKDRLGGWLTLSKEHTIWESEWGQVCLFSGCAGRFYDAYDLQGVYVGTTANLAAAQALLLDLSSEMVKTSSVTADDNR